jgi:hypothetical protein
MPEYLSLWPFKIVVTPFVTANLVAVNVTVQLMSHIFPTDSSEC